MAISTTRMAPVAMVLPSSATATFPPARRSAMIPDPTTVATSIHVPRNSATARRGRSNSDILSSRLGQWPADPVRIHHLINRANPGDHMPFMACEHWVDVRTQHRTVADLVIVDVLPSDVEFEHDRGPATIDRHVP